MEKIKYLLNQVRVINDKYKEIALAKGENFNLFNILDRRTDEVKTHSAIIAELLNPNGAHGLGTVFLKCFIEILDEKFHSSYENEFSYEAVPVSDLSNTKIYIEYTIGKISEDKQTGGRIDIILKNNEFYICIENKIKASDQDYQLRRYHNYLKPYSNINSLLIYLTLDGKDASNISTRNEECTTKLQSNENYFCLSYEHDILNWLIKCRDYCNQIPILYESIQQYIILIKSLTHQLTNDQMAEEISTVLLSDIRSSENIRNTFVNAIDTATDLFREAVIKELNNNSDVIQKIDINNFHKIKGLFVYTHHTTPELIGIESFSGEGHEKDSLFIGVVDFRPDSGLKRTKGIWVQGTLETIWTREEYLHNKLQQFVNGDQDSVVNELVKIILDFINRHFELAK